MTDYLVFHLYGAMAAWGDIAVGEQRPSTPHPSKSAIMGFLAAALGIRRHEDERHQALAENFGFAVRLGQEGLHLRDFHTAQIPKGTRRLKHLLSRRNELEDRESLYTVLSARDYRCDALYTICLWQISQDSPFSLTQLGNALRRPRFTLYLGRRSCPPALPVLPYLVQAETLDKAFLGFDAQQTEVQKRFFENTGLQAFTGGRSCYWGDEAATSPQHLQSFQIVPRHDEPRSRSRRQFGRRNEHFGVLKGD